MQKRATILHINSFVSVTPLVGGYLKAYALAEPEIRHNWDIELYSTHVRTPASEIIAHLTRARPQVIAFSAYTWNIGLIQRLLPSLRTVLGPATRFLLGGVEVMNCASKYVDPAWENVAVCNGEGEQTFRRYLLELGNERPDLEQVGGLTFAREAQWCTTRPYSRIRDLSEIPSPWLEGMFVPGDMAETALFETNRGCPFACEFCYWGGAIGERINKVEVPRLEEEITYIARHRTRSLSICDANFGMLRRDVEIAQHIARTNRDLKAPFRVTYNSAKNNPERVEQIARIFTEAGLLSHQPISLQTMSPRALELAKRDNIKKETYLRLQRSLNEWGVPSFVELIWPLPGETLESFKDGVNELCGMGAQSFMFHPLLWLNNVGYSGKTEEYGVSTLREDDPVGNTHMVIQTNEVSFEQWLEGLRFTLAAYLLFNCRALYTTMVVLNALGIASFREVFERFADFMDRRSPDDAISRQWHHGAARFEDLTKRVWQGGIAYGALHSLRKDFDQVLVDFMGEHPTWRGGEHARLLAAAFEFDLLSRPYPYLQTAFEVGAKLERLIVREQRRGVWVVDSPFDFPAIVTVLKTGGSLDAADLAERPTQITINHRSRQVFHLSARSEEEHYWHMHMAVREIGHLEPTYETRAAA